MILSSLRIKGSGIDVTEKIQSIVEQKLQPLERITVSAKSVLCEVELEKIKSHQTGRIHRAEINLTLDGVVYRADAVENQIEQAIDVARDEIKSEILKSRGKKERQRKKGQRVIKQMLHPEV